MKFCEIFLYVIVAIFTLNNPLFSAEEKKLPNEQKVWQGREMPTAPVKYSEKQLAENKDGVSMKYVGEASFRLFKPKSDKISGLVIVCPGGSYSWLCYDSEGIAPALWLSEKGICAMVLKYRIPNQPKGALEDIQRAIRVARANAKEWNIDPEKIAVMGFSAGGNLCARASAIADNETYPPSDQIDKISAQPNATILIYPAYCEKRRYDRRWNNSKEEIAQEYSKRYLLAPNLKVTKNTPPAIIWQNQADPYGDAAFAYYLALKDAGVPACLNIVGKEGHGGGLGGSGLNKYKKIVLERWLKEQKFPFAN